MNNLNIIKSFNAVSSKMTLKAQRSSPKILLFCGIAGGVTSAVLACKATLKAKIVVDGAKENIEEIRENAKPETVKKELTGAYMKAGLDVASLYLPSVGLGVMSIAAIITSHNILCKRNAGLIAAYTALETTFRDYRERVMDKYGEDAERRIRYNIHDEEIEETITDEKGKTKTVKKKIEVAGIDECSDFARYFIKYDANNPTKGSLAWERTPSYNEQFLNIHEGYLNQIFDANGVLLYNEVLKDLGFAPSKYTTAGWLKDSGNPKTQNYVKFTMFKVHMKNEDGEYEEVILIDFNATGNVVDKAVEKGLISK